jgi:chorismate dehydratase
VCAVSYLNTVPLVWGMQHGSEADGRGVFDLRFALPSECADQLASGEADIGIVPVIEMARQQLEYFRGTGIASHGPVRSILLISKVPFREIRTLATDSGSRTSVMLARVILREQFGVEPRTFSRPADLALMLGEADAALLIGDSALRVDPATLPFETLDLGEAWTRMTSLPMVFAVWAGAGRFVAGSQHDRYSEAFLASCRYGLAHVGEITERESQARGFSKELVRDYLTRHIVFELAPRDYEGLGLFLKHAMAIESRAVSGGIPA